MQHTRTPEAEVLAMRRRVAALLRKEARCPACTKSRKHPAGYPCEAHRRIRREMAR